VIERTINRIKKYRRELKEKKPIQFFCFIEVKETVIKLSHNNKVYAERI